MSMLVPYRALLVHISTVLQQVHHTVKVSLPGCPDQRSGPVLAHTHTRMCEEGRASHPLADAEHPDHMTTDGSVVGVVGEGRCYLIRTVDFGSIL